MKRLVLLLAACSSAGHGNTPDGSGGGGDGSGGNPQSYLVYAHSDTVLYTIDLQSKNLVMVGNFNAPNSDVITDLAVAPSGTIYTISKSSLYTASPTDGHVTKVGSLSTCGNFGVALTTTSDGRLWMGDYMGNICQIDISGATPVVKAPIVMQSGYALSGDMVGIGDGTVFGSAYKLSDSATQNDNLLVKLNVDTGVVTSLGATGYPKLFGLSFQENKVFGFTHDGSGDVVTIDTSTGAGSPYATFNGISFAGAGVNSEIVIQ